MIFLTLLLIPMLHYIADFECQNNWMALGKSKRLLPLLAHVAVYSAVFALFFGWQFGLWTFLFHFITDFVTSRWTSALWPFLPHQDDPRVYVNREGVGGRSRHRFFCVIGLDQMIHQYCLLLTALRLNPSVFGWMPDWVWMLLP